MDSDWVPRRLCPPFPCRCFHVYRPRILPSEPVNPSAIANLATVEAYELHYSGVHHHTTNQAFYSTGCLSRTEPLWTLNFLGRCWHVRGPVTFQQTTISPQSHWKRGTKHTVQTNSHKQGTVGSNDRSIPTLTITQNLFNTLLASNFYRQQVHRPRNCAT